MSAKLSFNHSFLQHSFFLIYLPPWHLYVCQKKSTGKIEIKPKKCQLLLHQHGLLLALQRSHFFSQSTSCLMNVNWHNWQNVISVKKRKTHKKEKVPRRRCLSLDLLVTSALIIARPAPFPRGSVKRPT